MDRSAREVFEAIDGVFTLVVTIHRGLESRPHRGTSRTHGSSRFEREFREQVLVLVIEVIEARPQ